MSKRIVRATLALALGAAFSLNALAQVKPEVLVEQRQAAMKLQGKYFFPLVPMAQGKVPYDAAVVARNAGYLDVLIRLAWDGFDPTTQGVKSRTLPEVYSDSAKFKAAQEASIADVTKLVAAVKSGNEANVKAAILDAAKGCAGCHDAFRQRQ